MAVHLAVAGDVFDGVLFLLSFFPRDVLGEIWEISYLPFFPLLIIPSNVSYIFYLFILFVSVNAVLNETLYKYLRNYS